ncbi:MAG TPA: sugar ABC transporter substrate-binding protein [Microbacterium sp.]|uniref:ABC transporter substrate-binding protein n=1 Tax=Microbacterium sp. TaxID=51671 RepID=UPI002B45BF9F|nr:sugar ABC transporter substrate-binding protein [Microbacterium sp.]HKT56171.1 sugar ABC transporter substrate-binding protein [Microbacterium sp.]
MSKEARTSGRRVRWMISAAAVTATAALALTGCSGGGGGNSANQNVTLTFSQWWAPEMPTGALQGIVDSFHKEHPKITIKLISAPFPSLQTQTISEAASGTLPDIVGLDGSWVNPLYKQGALLNLTDAMKSAKYDDSQLASQVAFKGSTYMIPVVNFVYPLFTNDAVLAKAGITAPPTTWSQFTADAKKISQTESGVKGWVVPLGTTNPNGAQNDILSWAWASGGSMLSNGEPNLTNNPDVQGAVDMVKDLVTSNAVLPGANSLQETDKVTNFINGRVGMMVDSLAHVTTITKGAPNLKFTVSAQPVKDGYTGTKGMLTASWGIGVSAKTKYPTQAWQFIQYLMSKDTNSKLSTLANGFPGNKTSAPDFSGADPHFKTAFGIYQQAKPVNEFTGLPAADQLMTSFLTEFQKVTAGQESTSTMLQNVQAQWKKQF